MASILFAQLQQFPYPGLYYICGSLKASGHPYEVLATSRVEMILRRIEAARPDVVAFPCMTGFHRDVLAAARAVKKKSPNTWILLGGVHPTLFPSIIEEPEVDLICRGEGEMPTVELLDALDQGRGPSGVMNISWKEGASIRHNEMRPLADPLDGLPFPDYSIYRDNPVISSDTYPAVFMTRGCPFSCSYCHNSKQRTLYKGLGRYVRSFSTGRILDEVESAIECYPHTRAVMLGADTLGTDMDWLTELLTRYRSRFRVPFTCLIRPEFITEDLAHLLSETGCHMVAFGIESGSERIRHEFLKRRYSNEDIVRAADTLRKYGIRFRTYNIIGFPTETRAEMLQTLDLNLAVKPDFPWCSIYTPYPETELTDFALSQGYLDSSFSFDDVPVSFFNDTVLKGVDRDFILNLHSFFQATVLFRPLRRWLGLLLSLRPNGVYRLLFKAVYSLVCIRSENRSVLSYLKLGLANRRLFR